MGTYDVLGLVLAYMHSSMTQNWLCQLFAVTPSTLNRYLLDGKTALLCTLKSLRLARVKWPSARHKALLAARVQRAQPALKGCFGFVDGLNLRIHEPSDPLVQNAYYNGWLHYCVCSSIFVFCPLGTIIYYFLNAPGCEHDSALSVELYSLLLRRCEAGFGLAADSAFVATGDMEGKIFKPLRTDQLAKMANSVTVTQLATAIKKHRAAVSVRQVGQE